jgi:hypothetical protein
MDAASAALTLGGVYLMYKTLTGPATPTAGSGSQVTPFVSSGGSVLLLGDSIGVGLDGPLSSDLAAQGVNTDASVTVGQSIRGQVAALGPPARQYKVVLLSLGSNDTAASSADGSTNSEGPDLQKIVDFYKPYGSTLLWIWPPSFIQGALTPAQQGVAATFLAVGVSPVPIQGALPSVASDPMKLHPTPQGYAAYAQQIAAALVGVPLASIGSGS